MSANKIRPAARLIRTIGQDLIKDVYAAIVELVKNAYDADSLSAIIRFNFNVDRETLSISIEDQGHGMTLDTVVNKWLVPATDDKLKRKRSDSGRTLQGRKGIGRFAAGILGDRILLDTCANGKSTSFLLDMEELENTKFLDEFDIEIEENTTSAANGTRIEIEKSGVTTFDVKNIWNPRQIQKLLIELRSLTAPEEIFQVASRQGYEIRRDSFEIRLIFEDFPIEEYSGREIIIKPFPILDLYDYKISGIVNSLGIASLTYENSNVAAIVEKINFTIPLDEKENANYPGEIFIDLRVYDRDPNNIENIIKRGLIDPDTNEYVGKQEARKILDEYYGVGIYREQFRIRPYGEQSFDWLDLDKKRVQNPSYKIGHNQVIGFIHVRPEEISGLQEKSARDGLAENGAYLGLLSVVSKVINELEVRRFQYRQKSMKGGRSKSLDEELEHLFDFKETKNKISRELKNIGITNEQQEQIQLVLNNALDSESLKKSDYVRKIRDTIAIYQGQATLGKITHVILHEGRKNIKYISETVPRIAKWAAQLSKKPDPVLEITLHERSEKTLTHTKSLTFLFKKIEPLARTRRSPAKNLILKDEIQSAFDIYAAEIELASIDVEIDFEDKNIVIHGTEIDVITIFSNLVENSLFWLSHNGEKQKKINVQVFSDSSNIVVEFKDSGPGFQGGNLELMFEPGYSMKPSGMGLGLALVGEAISRVGGTIEAKHSNDGAIFELIFKKQND